MWSTWSLRDQSGRVSTVTPTFLTDSGNTHRQHVVYVVSPRPVGPSLDRNSDISHLSTLRDMLGLLKGFRLLIIESIKASLHEFLLIRARHERKGSSYQDQLDFIDKVAHVP